MRVSEELKARVIVELQRCIAIANRAYKQNFTVPVVKYDVRGTRAGYVHGIDWVVHLNPDFFTDHAEEMIEQTAPHELAHLVDTYVNPEAKERPMGFTVTRRGQFRRAKRSIHGPTWKDIMYLFGKDADRCHDMDMTNVRTKKRARFAYKCGQCGVVAHLGPKHHKAIQMRDTGAAISFKQCKRRHGYLSKLNYMPDASFKLTGGEKQMMIPRQAPVPAPRPTFKPSFVPAPAPARIIPQTGTKTKQQLATDLVRNNTDKDRSELIKMIMTQLDMTQAGASTYYYNAKKLLERIQASTERTQPTQRLFVHA